MKRFKPVGVALATVFVVGVAAVAFAILTDMVTVPGNQFQTGDFTPIEGGFDFQVAALPESLLCGDVAEVDWQDGPVFTDGVFDELSGALTLDAVNHDGSVFCLRRVDDLAVDMNLAATVQSYVGTDPACSAGEVDVDPDCGVGAGEIAQHYRWRLVTQPPAVEGAPCVFFDTGGTSLLQDGVSAPSLIIPDSFSGVAICAVFRLTSNLSTAAATAVQSDSATWTWVIDAFE